jgi:hypothetical protein
MGIPPVSSSKVYHKLNVRQQFLKKFCEKNHKIFTKFRRALVKTQNMTSKMSLFSIIEGLSGALPSVWDIPLR